MARPLSYRQSNDPDYLGGGGGDSPASRGPFARSLLLALLVILTVGIIAAIAGDQSPSVFQTLVFLVFLFPLLVPAWMLGLWLTEPFDRRHCFDNSPWPAGFRSLVAIALGLGSFSLATLLMGTLHLIEPGGNPWPVTVVPILAAAIGFLPARRFVQSFDRTFFTRKSHRGEWLLLLAAVPLAILLISASFPPGTLWGPTEARGYDVLEYHLELPREYGENNSTSPVAHNVYSFFPSNIEMLYLFLTQVTKGAMQGEPGMGYVWGAIPSQYCHAMLMLLTAAALMLMPLGRAGNESKGAMGGVTGRAIAVLVFLGIPWTIITGSLAYNEGGMLLFGTLALGLALGGGETRANGILVGLLLGLAVGCKMTAGVFFALPVAALLIIRSALALANLRALLPTVLVASAVYAPWAIRAAVSSRGNPVFPIATSILPKNDWTPEQSERFSRGHAAPESLRPLAARIRALVRCSLFDGNWSVQPYALLHFTDKPPALLDTWWKRIGHLWYAVPLALAAALIPRAFRPLVLLLLIVLLIQILAWLFTTHLQSRFLLPMAIPLSLLLGLGVQGLHLSEGVVLSGLRIAAGTLVVLHTLCTAFLLLPEANLLGGLVGRNAKANPLLIGRSFSVLLNVSGAAEHPNAMIPVDEPITGKVLLLGDATAWRFVGQVEYHTVFDKDPFLDILRTGDARKAVAWLQQRDIRYLWIDWSEVARLRKSYGFDEVLTPAAIAGLAAAGVTDMHMIDLPIQVLRVPEPAK